MDYFVKAHEKTGNINSFPPRRRSELSGCGHADILTLQDKIFYNISQSRICVRLPAVWPCQNNNPLKGQRGTAVFRGRARPRLCFIAFRKPNRIFRNVPAYRMKYERRTQPPPPGECSNRKRIHPGAIRRQPIAGSPDTFRGVNRKGRKNR